ncbi:MAG TPA: hypothetical protein VM032_16845 [Vicinamibacterales bacterium]|nr:hypothetical protein [Vicinamibacterales bacterium]
MSRTKPASDLAAEFLEPFAEKFDQLAFARQFVPTLLVVGLFSNDDCSPDTTVAEEISRHAAFYNIGRIEADRAQAMKSPDVAAARQKLDELCVESFISGSAAGYLLGLAVGQVLGPDALKVTR